MATTTAPRWIKLDEIVSAALRADLAAFAERLDTYGASEEDTELAVRLYRRYDEETRGKGLPAEFILDVNEWSGYSGLSRQARTRGSNSPGRRP
jgi:hypothetical protein